MSQYTEEESSVCVAAALLMYLFITLDNTYEYRYLQSVVWRVAADVCQNLWWRKDHICKNMEHIQSGEQQGWNFIFSIH